LIEKRPDGAEEYRQSDIQEEVGAGSAASA